MVEGCIWIFRRDDESPCDCVFPQHVIRVTTSGSANRPITELQCTHGTYDIELSMAETAALVLKAHAGEQVSVSTHNRDRYFTAKS